MKLSVVIPVYNQEKLVLQAIKSVPHREDVEIIVVDDCSTDRTKQVVESYIAKNKDRNIRLISNENNGGCGYSLNQAIPLAKGDYLVWLGSDDYFYTNELIKVLDQANGHDLVYFNLRTNENIIFRLNEETKYGYCGSVKLMRREFVGDTRNPNIRTGEDWYFFRELQEKKPTEIFTDITAKHYNFPRVNSLSWQAIHGSS